MLVPAGLRALANAFPSTLNLRPEDAAGANFQLHPHYRMQRPLDATLLKVNPELDDFISEKYAARLERTLAQWSAALLNSPQDTRAIEQTLAKNFAGPSLRSSESKLVRSSSGLQVWKNKFEVLPSVDKAAFLPALRGALQIFSKILTAEFQIVSVDWSGIQNGQPVFRSLQTSVRYEIVGTGRDFHREQRVGNWDLTWQVSTDGSFRLAHWQWLDEMRTRASAAIFLDVAEAAFAGSPSYSSQLLHGVDYWRTVLDGACGIDIYGHNGVSVADIDDDGYDDLYVCQPAGLPNRLYRNRGDGTFEDLTESSGLGILDNTACALFADFDNDGRQDVVVVRASGPLLFLNQGNGKFQLKPDAFKFVNPPQGTFTGAAIADYDRDGWLDIYFCLYAYYQGTDQYKYPLPYYAAENGPPNFMMKNNRDGSFRDVTKESGLNQNNTRYSFCCAWNDYNNDSWPDLYVVNDFGRKNLYRNNGDGTFIDVAHEMGVEDVGAGMSVSWFGQDNDGAADLYVADMWTAAGERIATQPTFKANSPAEVRALYRKHAMGNSLFHNAGKSFKDATASAGVSMGRWSWSSDVCDFDHDGLPDIYIANGMISGPSREDLNSFFWRQVVSKSPDDARAPLEYEQGWNAINELVRADGTWSGYERNVFYANNGDGTFSDVSGAINMDFLEDARAFALADFDHDGRQELFLKNRSGPQLRVLKNVIAELPPAISFWLKGTRSNRDAIGATVTITTDSSTQVRTLQAGSGFLSQHSKEVFFGLGNAKGSIHASIHWPSGTVQELHDLPPGHRISVEEGSAKLRMEPFQKSGPTISRRPTETTAAELLPLEVETWLLTPVPAPFFSLPDLSGTLHDLNQYRGNPIFLNFWASAFPDGEKNLIALRTRYKEWTALGVQVLSVNCDEHPDLAALRLAVRENQFLFPVLCATNDVIAVYNILYRYLFDRHRDLNLSTSFLIDDHSQIVKVYQGALNPEQVERDVRHLPKTSSERMDRALPFRGVADSFEFGRNHLSLGSVFFQRGYFDQAETSFQLALKDDPASAEALYGLGSVYLKQQKNMEARQNFERATKAQTGYPGTLPNAWNNLGLLATMEGHFDEAIGYFRRALDLSPEHSVALVNLGSAYRQQKNWHAARAAFEHALQVNTNDAEANYGMGMVFAQTDDAEQAQKYLQEALKLRPVYPEALNNLGVLYLRTQRKEQAIANFEECIRIAPDFDQSYLNLARVYAIEGTTDKARAVLMQLLKQRPDDASAKQALEQLGR